jgi:DNA primase
MSFPDGFIEEVRRGADIVALIGDHVSLRKAGASWKGRCPFHDEKTPSFNVRQEPPVFHCFGCGVGGDVFKFLMLRDQASFPEAVEAVARRFGITVPERRPGERGERRAREQLFELLEAAATRFEKNLWSAPGAQARTYLTGRGFDEETLRRLRVGAAPDSWRDLLGALEERYPAPRLVAAGLALERRGGSGHYDRFRNRVVFPILNESGRVLGFGARSLDGSEPKYLNSPETPVYHKGQVLYGLSWAREKSRKSGRLILMEGYLDVARAVQRGGFEAVATCGTALTSSHARLLHRFCERVYLSFDQDEAGIRATERSGELLLEAGLDVRVVTLPEGHDPDSFLAQAGEGAYGDRLDAALHYVEWLADRAARQHDVSSPPGKAAYFKALLPALRRVRSEVERSAWLTRVADRGGVDPAAATRELRRAVGAEAPPPPREEKAVPAARIKLLPVERWLISMILERVEGVEEAMGQLGDADLAGLGSAELLRAAQKLQSQGEVVTPEALDAALDDEAARRLVNEIAVDPPPVERVTAADCVREIKGRALETRIAALREQVRRADASAQNLLLQEQLQLKQQLANLHRAPAAGH